METNTNTNNCDKCNIKWKNDISSVKIALIPANSRPLLQPRFWHVKNRPMPELLTNENDNTLEIIDAQYSLIKSTNVNNEDYLQYNNPDVKLNSDGAIVCDNEDGVFHNNMYSGPGWKKSRTHPNTRTALSRPIKHWRKQLFPRQFNYDATDSTDSTKTPSRGRRNSGGLFDKPNGYFITDKIVSKEISCLPIYVNTTKDDLNSCLQLDIINYGKIINCSIKTALFKSRPGSYTSNSIYQFKSNKAYLQARSKLYEQLANVNNSTTPNSSFYLNYNRNINPGNCKTVPSIVVNNNHYPLSSKTNMRRKSKNAIIQNQYNITNKYGITAPNIKVLPPPTANLIASAYAILIGDSITLIPTITNLFGGTAYIYVNSSSILNGNPIILGRAYTITPTVTTSYTLSVTNGAGFSVNSSVTITVVQMPTATLSITAGSSTITRGQSVTLKSVFTNAVSATIDNSSSFNNSVVTNNGTYTITPPVGTNIYTLRVTNSIGYQATSIITITVLPLLTATLSITAGSSTITSGQSVTLKSVFDNAVSATIDNSSLFNNSVVTNNGTYTITPPVGTNTYTLRVTNSIDFPVTSSVTITVLPLPTATLSITAGSSSITSGQGQQVTLRSLFSNGDATINDVSPFNGVVVTNNGTYIVSPTDTTLYRLRVVNSLGFNVDSSVTITVVPVPTGTLNLTSGSSTITNSESVTMAGTFANGTADIIRVSTSNNSQIISTIHSNINLSQSYSITPDVTSAYRLRVTNSANYSIYSNIITITVLPRPILELTSGSSTITASESVTVRGTFANGTADIIRVSTSNNSQIISTVHSNIISFNNYSITPVVTSAYRLRVTNSANYSILSSNTITITVTPRTGYYGIITFKFYDVYPENTTYSVTMTYGNLTFTSNNNLSNVSHEITEENRLVNANSIITITLGINSPGNVYILNYGDFFYNNEIKNWSAGSDMYKIPQGVANVPLDFIISLVLNDDD